MSFTLDQAAERYPFLFHLTARENIDFLRETRQLFPAKAILIGGGKKQCARERRPAHMKVEMDGRAIVVRDQKPLHKNNMRLLGGWSYEDFVECVNSRVFFWPARTASRPIKYGLNHFGRYVAEKPILLRIPTKDLFAVNPAIAPEFCKYNSGAPRWSRGVAAPRGPQTFVQSQNAPFGVGQVVEVTLPGVVNLPTTTVIAESLESIWRPC